MRREIGHIADAANVDNHAMDCWVTQHAVVKRRNQRRTLSARRDVATAEIIDYLNTRELGEQGGITDLQSVAVLRTMADRLTMTAYCADLMGPDAGLLQQRHNAPRIQARQLVAGNLRAVQFVVGWAVQCQQFGSERCIEGVVMPCQQCGFAVAKSNKDGINAVQARSGHQPYVKLLHERA